MGINYKGGGFSVPLDSYSERKKVERRKGGSEVTMFFYASQEGCTFPRLLCPERTRKGDGNVVVLLGKREEENPPKGMDAGVLKGKGEAQRALDAGRRRKPNILQ